MRQGQNGKRSRGNRRNNSNTNRTIDSTGPEVKIRGSASHIYEKYQSLAREANIAGERIVSEGYLQHAEHYYRQMNQTPAGNSRGARPEGQGDDDHRRRDNEQRRDDRSRPDDVPGPAPSNGSGSGEAQSVAETAPAEGQEVPAGLPPAAPQQPGRRRARGRRSANETQQENSTASTEVDEAKAKTEAPDPAPTEVVEDRGATEEA